MKLNKCAINGAIIGVSNIFKNNIGILSRPIAFDLIDKIALTASISHIFLKEKETRPFRTTLRRILNKNASMLAYKIQLIQKLKQSNHPKRSRFAEFN